MKRHGKGSSHGKEQIVFYSDENGRETVSVYYEDETFWLTQRSMAELFDVESNTITYHLKEIYATDELDKGSTTRKFRVVQIEGSRSVAREVDHYNLDAIIAVGYRVNSKKATRQFAIRNSQWLYIIKIREHTKKHIDNTNLRT